MLSKETLLNRLDELGFEKTDPFARTEVRTDFFQRNDFYAVKYIKDRSPSGMLYILSGGKWRWQIRVGQKIDGHPRRPGWLPGHDGHLDYIIALWDAKEGVTYDRRKKIFLDTGTPVFMLRTVKAKDNCLDIIEKHIIEFEKYALNDENHCPKCSDMLIPRKAKKLRVEAPFVLAMATRGEGSLPKQRTYLACNAWPKCDYIQSYVKENNETV
jgi:hypothetical protein